MHLGATAADQSPTRTSVIGIRFSSKSVQAVADAHGERVAPPQVIAVEPAKTPLSVTLPASPSLKTVPAVVVPPKRGLAIEEGAVSLSIKDTAAAI